MSWWAPGCRAPARSASPWQEGRDAGAGTVLAIGVVAVVLSATAVLAVAVRGLAGAQRARAAADLAALAGAQAVALPDGLTSTVDPQLARDLACGRAREVAVRNGGVMGACDVRGAVVTLTVRAGGPWPAHATARAGPAP
ncbi:histidine kinase [Isoptericola sp. b441]|uniref:Histidine kinase n=1 Tax=Actinotalea lenta TaxID=3064654 RepID=A0ABT9D7W1_9CELL|nr:MULTISPECIES: histidine kinase [unclassified Isoptericola]MDO8106536.1 histidine kinase [Isoptericola sp. b441]MDO8121756.1 histidine kinase [Isoptericola sp. b490]